MDLRSGLMSYLYVRSKEVQLIETESKEVAARQWEVGRVWVKGLSDGYILESERTV